MCTKLKNDIEGYLRASFPLIYIVSSEEARVQRIVGAVCNNPSSNGEPLASLFVWEEVTGIKPGSDHTKDLDIDYDKLEKMNIAGFLTHASNIAEACANNMDTGAESPWDNACYLAKDIHYMFKAPNPMLYRMARVFARRAEKCGHCIIGIGPPIDIPDELRHEFVVIDCDLPNREDISRSITELAVSLEMSGDIKNSDSILNALNSDGGERIIEAATGMTEKEILGSVSLSLVKNNSLDREFIAGQKVASVKKSGFLEIWPTESMDNIGGLHELKTYLRTTERAFTNEARTFGIKEPKGILAVGCPGTGKTLSAKVTGSLFKRPVLRFDVASVFGSLVGQSESQIRQAIKTAEAAAPCVLFVDEIEKAFSGSGGGSLDGGTSVRVFGTFLSWMQDHESQVYVVATANAVDSLPPELLRKGRFDEIFWFDLPNDEERKEIWKIHISKAGRDPEDKKFSVEKLVAGSDGYTGAEIEQVVHDALRDAFADNAKDMDYHYIQTVLKRTKPLSVTRAADIVRMREHGEKHFRAASIKQQVVAGSTKTRRIRGGE